MNNSTFMPLPELFGYFLKICPNVISILMEISKLYNSLMKIYVNGIMKEITSDNINEIMDFLIDHDIVYGIKNISFNRNEINDEHYMHKHHIRFVDIRNGLWTRHFCVRSCKMKSHRIMSFLFKYDDYCIIKWIPLDWSPLALMIQTFNEIGLTNHLNNLVHGIPRKNLLFSIFLTLENILKHSEKTDICDVLTKFLFDYIELYDLNEDILINYLYVMDTHVLFPTVFEFLKLHNLVNH